MKMENYMTLEFPSKSANESFAETVDENDNKAIRANEISINNRTWQIRTASLPEYGEA